MKLARLHVDGFGGLVDRDVCFGEHLNIVVGPNEAGKSTLCAAVLAMLYGPSRGEKDAWRPWSGARYAATLTYTLGDGRRFEIQREFERDAKGIRVYDVHGNDASSACAVGKHIIPGHAHLGIPLEVFVNASFVGQRDVAIDGSRAERIAHALARALDGGPREDAALGALKRLDDAAAQHVGKKRATINAPLRNLQVDITEAQARADDMRARLRALDGLRARLETETQRARDLTAALRERERRLRVLRAFGLRSRLEALREVRDELAELHAERERYNDVATFDIASVPEFEERYHAWQTALALARASGAEAGRARAASAAREGAADEAAVPDAAAFAQLERALAAAGRTRRTATLASRESPRAGAEFDEDFVRAPVAAGFAASISAAGFGAEHHALPASIGAAAAIVCFVLGLVRLAARRAARTTALAAARDAEAAQAQLARMLASYGAASFDELLRRRERSREVARLRAEDESASARSRDMRKLAAAAGRDVDALGAQLAPEWVELPQGERSRAAAFATIKLRERRKRAREGLELRLSMLAMRRSDVLGNEEEFALEAELRDLTAAGVDAAAIDTAQSDAPRGYEQPARALEAERRDLERRAAESATAVAASAAELRAAEAHIGDIAALDERVLVLRERAERLERFDAAVALARLTIEERTLEAHQRFAYRLADYASSTLAGVTGDKYLDVRVDPATLAVRVRVPQTGEIVDVERLSAGTREQAYLVVRLAMARMLSEGLETAPLLLDDPFAYWDDARIARGLPVLQAAARDAQVVFFSTSPAFARESAARGAHVIDLTLPADDALAQRPAV